MENSKKPNYFVRILIISFCIGLALMIGYNFIMVEPKGVIKSGIYLLIAILLVLVLSESFDNFSIGQLISMKREINNKATENHKLEKKNSELISHILSITTVQNQNQKQQSTTVFGDLYTEPKKDLQNRDNKNDSAQELLDRIGNSIVINEIENSIKNELQEKQLNIEGDTIAVLIRHLAGTQLLLEFERIHALIFGSQLFLLKQLNMAISQGGIPEAEVFAHFERVKQIHDKSFEEWDFDSYMEFLLGRLLVIRDESKRMIQITNLGVEYLTWIARNGINDERPL